MSLQTLISIIKLNLLIYLYSFLAKQVQTTAATASSTQHNYRYNIGSEINITESSAISSDNLNIILSKSTKESIYYLGLLSLYGLSIPKNTTFAMENFQEAADMGHIEAQTAYAVLLLEDNIDNVEEAKKYLRISAESGDINAQFYLAKLYITSSSHQSNNTNPDLDISYVYLQNVVKEDRSHAEALHYLGILHEYGLCKESKLSNAIEMYKLAANLRYLESMYNLGLLYAYGRGVEQDFARSASLFLNAARAGHPPSMYYMGITKTYGYGCAIDYIEAVTWFEKAVATDDLRVRDKAKDAAINLNTQLGIAQKYRKETISVVSSS